MLATVIVGAGTIAKIVAWGGGLAAGIVALFLKTLYSSFDQWFLRLAYVTRY